MKHLICLAALAIYSTVNAASIDEGDLVNLRTRAKLSAFVPVHVVVAHATTEEIAKSPRDFLELTNLNAQSILRELGSDAASEGRHIGIGSMDIWVSASGLDKLRASKSAIRFLPGPEWNHNILISDSDRSLTTVSKLLEKSEFVDVELTLNVDGAEVLVDKTTGKGSLQISTEAHRKSIDSLSKTLASTFGLEELKSSASSRTGSLQIKDSSRTSQTGVIVARVNELGLSELARHHSVRAIKPLDYAKGAPTFVDPDAKKEAARSGETEVLVKLHRPLVSGKISQESFAAQKRSQERMLKEVLSTFTTSKDPQLFPYSASASIKVNLSDLEKIEKLNDARIASVSANKPLYTQSLATATPTLGLPAVWSGGTTGSGQIIVVIDSGVKKSHAWFAGKVPFEGCYQSNGSWEGLTWVSSCPGAGPGTNGDSPFNYPGAGEPLSSADCLAYAGIGSTTNRNDVCGHGTHVAGIAAGLGNSATQRGVAYGASIFPINAFSGGPGLRVLRVDYNATLEGVLAAANAEYPGSNAPYTVNMSLGDGRITDGSHTSPSTGVIDAPNFIDLIDDLKGKAIPVVAAMGNEGRNYGMQEPANVAGVIKVGSLKNNGANPPTSSDVSSFSNFPLPSRFPGEYIFFAPGGNPPFPTDDVANRKGLWSAHAYSTSTDVWQIAGTSQATPVVSGFYALVKSLYPNNSLADVSNFIRNSVSISFQAQGCPPPTEMSCNNQLPSTYYAVRAH